jgi:hypothetical protein
MVVVGEEEEEDGSAHHSREVRAALQELVTEALHGRIIMIATAAEGGGGMMWPRYRATLGEVEGVMARVFALVESLTAVTALNRSVHQALLERLVREEAWAMMGDPAA